MAGADCQLHERVTYLPRYLLLQHPAREFAKESALGLRGEMCVSGWHRGSHRSALDCGIRSLAVLEPALRDAPRAPRPLPQGASDPFLVPASVTTASGRRFG